MSDERTTIRIEAVKIVTDYFKHLTTLATGSLVLIATFIEKFGPHTQWRMLAAVSVGGFIVSIMGNLVANGVLVFRAEAGEFEDTRGAEETVEVISFLVAILGFLVATISLSIFAIKNLL